MRHRWPRRLAGSIVLALALTVGTLEPAPARPGWGELVRSLPCRGAIEARLALWNASSDAYRAPSVADGSDHYRIPTGELGVWITLHVRRDRGVRLYRNEAASGLEVELDAACNASERTLPGLAPVEGPGFTDAELEALVAAHDRLVVYLWTPNLPLSVEGYVEIREASAAVGAALVAVVDPSADRDYVREVADAEGIPERARRSVASVELLFRDLAVHAPAVLVYRNGRAGPVLPGYRSRQAYIEYLSKPETR